MKVKKSKTLETIASELEEEEADIKPIYEAVVSSAPDYDINVIKDRLDNMCGSYFFINETKSNFLSSHLPTRPMAFPIVNAATTVPMPRPLT